LLLNVIEEEESSVVRQREEKKPGRHLLDNTSLDKYWTKNINAVMGGKKKYIYIYLFED
jgi:hypothetical protein